MRSSFAVHVELGLTKRLVVVDIECSSAVGCDNIRFEGFEVSGPAGDAPEYICKNVLGLDGLEGEFPPG